MPKRGAEIFQEKTVERGESAQKERKVGEKKKLSTFKSAGSHLLGETIFGDDKAERERERERDRERVIE